MLAVILSAVLHATWNFLLRRAGGSSTVAAMSIVAEAILLLPLAVLALYSSGGVPLGQFVPAVVIAAVLALANYGALMAAYRGADLSLAYPVARGGVFLFLPLLGFLVFDERLDAWGWLAVTMIVAGILLLPLRQFDRHTLVEMARHFRNRALLFALLAAASTAGYTVWDKYSIGFLDTFLYFAGYSILLGIWFAVVLARTPRNALRAEMRTHGVSAAITGLLIAVSYLLVLVALRDGMTTQVLAVRQLSIPIGVLLGWRLLREALPAPRALGALLVTLGGLIAAAT